MSRLNYTKVSKQWTKAKENAFAASQEKTSAQKTTKVVCPRGFEVVTERVSGAKMVATYVVPTKTRHTRNGGNVSHTPIYDSKSDTVAAFEPWQMRKITAHGEVKHEAKAAYKPTDFRFFG